VIERLQPTGHSSASSIVVELRIEISALRTTSGDGPGG
jgi:hypothetical protein